MRPWRSLTCLIGIATTMLTLIASTSPASAQTAPPPVPSRSVVGTGSFTADGRWVGGYIDGRISVDTSGGIGWFGVSKRTRIGNNEMVEIIEAVYLENVPRYRFDPLAWTASASGTMPSIVTRIDWKRVDGGWTATDVQRNATAKVSLRWKGLGEPSIKHATHLICAGAYIVACVPYVYLIRKGPASVWGWVDFGGLGLRIHVPEGKIGRMVHYIPFPA